MNNINQETITKVVYNTLPKYLAHQIELYAKYYKYFSLATLIDMFKHEKFIDDEGSIITTKKMYEEFYNKHKQINFAECDLLDAECPPLKSLLDVKITDDYYHMEGKMNMHDIKFTIGISEIMKKVMNILNELLKKKGFHIDGLQIHTIKYAHSSNPEKEVNIAFRFIRDYYYWSDEREIASYENELISITGDNKTYQTKIAGYSPALLLREAYLKVVSEDENSSN